MTKKAVLTVGELLRETREKYGLPLRKVAASIDIDTSLLGKIERNERQATKDQAKQLAAFYGLDERKLLREILSDQLAYMVLDEEADVNALRLAEVKIEYLKSNNYGREN